MKKIKEDDPYKQILDETNQLIQVSRRSDFTMLYAYNHISGYRSF